MSDDTETQQTEATPVEEVEYTPEQLFELLDSNNEEIQKLKTTYQTHIPTSVLIRKIMMSSYVALSKLRKHVLETKKAIPVKKREPKKKPEAPTEQPVV